MAKLKIGMKWDGLKELKADLKTFPKDLTDDTRPIVQAKAKEAAETMRLSYPRSGKKRQSPVAGARGTPGPLADSVVVTEGRRAGPTVTSITIANTAFYSHMFEYGTRHSAPGRVFVPIFLSAQREMVDAVKATFPAHNLRERG